MQPYLGEYIAVTLNQFFQSGSYNWEKSVFVCEKDGRQGEKREILQTFVPKPVNPPVFYAYIVTSLKFRLSLSCMLSLYFEH